MNTSFIITLLILGLGIVIGSPNPSLAKIHNDIVFDSNGNFVRTIDKGCVRTKFLADKDPCFGNKTEVSTKIMGMDERIVYFNFDKYELTPEAKDKLRVLSEVLTHHNITAIKVVGYTDRIGSDDYNYKLSQKRANSVSQFINSLVKLESSIMEIRGLGKIDLIKECSGIKKAPELIKCLAPNRRVEIEVDFYDNEKKVILSQ